MRQPGSEIIEIGTFDGRTALNLAVNAPERTTVVTLDLPAGAATAFAIEEARADALPTSRSRARACAPAAASLSDYAGAGPAGLRRFRAL